MKVLFITSNRLGDAVLSTGVLKYIAQEHPDAKVTIACGWLPSTVFEGYPQLERVIEIKKKSMHRHWIDLWLEVKSTKWDWVIDFRDSAVSRFVGAKKKSIFSKQINKKQHKVEQASQFLGVDTNTPPAPHIWLTDEQKAFGRDIVSTDEKILGVGPTANWIGKTWPPESFIELISHLTDKGQTFEGYKVAVFAAPGEEENAEMLLSSVPQDKQINVISKGKPGDVCGVLAQCDFYIGNDSGLMHCAAALGVPTLGLFGPSYPHWYSPWGAHCSFVRTPETFDELIDFDGYDPKTLKRSLMVSLNVETVIDAVNQHVKALR